MRNHFYYTMHTLCDNFTVHMLPLDHDLQWNEYNFRWNPVFHTLDSVITDYIIRASMYDMPRLLFVETGSWPLLSRPLVDYIFGIKKLVNHFAVLRNMGINIFWQPIAALPQKPYVNRIDISNHLIVAMNYYACTTLHHLTGVPCSINWQTSLAWSNELICAANTHTMCFQDNFNVLPPGRVASEQLLKLACQHNNE